MEVAFFGQGPVADRCLAVALKAGLKLEKPDKAKLWLSVHHQEVFDSAPEEGILNLHNSYLPWGRGANPCSWAIVDRTPHGATLHWVDHSIDTGPIFHQKAIVILPHDTADSLYKRTAELEVEVFYEAMLMLMAGDRRKIPQPQGGSYHSKRDFQRLVRAVSTSDCEVKCV